MKVGKKILLVEPNFPVPAKSKNHKDFLPIGLLKIASYLKANGVDIKLVRGELKIEDLDFKPDEIWITSLFTYWSKYVKDSVAYYKKIFPYAKVVVGGIYASLMPEHCKEYTKCDDVFIGVHKEAEKYPPSYELINHNNPHPIDYQIIHASRGCIRRCDFCGTWKIEPVFEPKTSIRDEIKYSKIIFYDNNLLANPYIEEILQELIELKKKRKILWCETQSGFDGRILMDKPHLARMLKEASFRYPRIAWDWRYNEYEKIKKQINILLNAGYKSKDIYIFMLYNWEIPFKEMEMKRVKCWEWKVQIADCRYRPLDQTFDNYDPEVVGQTNKDYYIHIKGGWTDALIKQFRKNVRRQNICVRHGFPFHSKLLERKGVSKGLSMKLRNLSKRDVLKILPDAWFPDEICESSINASLRSAQNDLQNGEI